MATAFDTGLAKRGEVRFFLVMAWIMAATIVAGFSLNLALGRSSFAMPPVFHIHAFVFFAWVALYVTQNTLVASGQVALHRKLGVAALVFAPLMVGLGIAVTYASLRRGGGPIFFDQNAFMIGNPLQLFLFGALVLIAIANRRRADWHKRLMFGAMTILTGPGIGRIAPIPLLVPWAWWGAVLLPLIFPVIGMIADWRRDGRIHPAWFWIVGSIVGVHLIAESIAYSAVGYDLTRWVIEGTSGALRPMQGTFPGAP